MYLLVRNTEHGTVKLHASQRSKVAEAIARRLIKRRGERMKTPRIYVVKMSRYGAAVGGCYYHHGNFITLRVGTKSNRRDQYILLVHELSHHIDRMTAYGKWLRSRRPHGERFQRILWGTLTKALWRRASNPSWVAGRSGHEPKYQPDQTVSGDQ
jgi:hypothetical protein